MFKRYFTKFSKLVKLVGAKASFWMIMIICGSFFLGMVELGFAFFIQIFMKSTGILNTDIPIPKYLLIPIQSTTTLGAVLLLIGIVRAVGQFLVAQGSIIACETINQRLRLVLLYDTLINPEQKSISASDISTKLADTFPKAASFCFYSANFVGTTIQICILGVMMLNLCWKEALVGFSGLLIVGITITRISTKIRKMSEVFTREFGQLSQGIQRVSRNWLLVKVLRTNEFEHANLVTNVLNYTNVLKKVNYYINIGSCSTPSFGILLLIIIILISQNYFKTPGIQLLAFLYIFMRFVQTAAGLAAHYSSLSSYTSQIRSASTFFFSFRQDQLSEALSFQDPKKQCSTGNSSARETKMQSSTRPPSIVIQNLSFAYENANSNIFSGLNLNIKSGEQFALIGQSGCGKSTLLALILGILQPDSGSVLIDGVSATDFFANTAFNIGYVGAEPFLIEGTIKQNITYGSNREVKDEAIYLALEKAQLLKHVLSLEDGLNYTLTENGDGLSAGQKQRLCLTRALLNNPTLLILDEVSANLDERTEKEIADGLKVLKDTCTVLIVSHRAGMLVHADNVLNL